MGAITVDARGEQCPIPVVRATKAIGEMTEPSLLEVHVDNEIAVQNVLRMASGKGYAAKSEQTGEKHFVITVDVDRLPEKDAEPDEAVCQSDRRANTVVAIGTATMGVGSDELGKTLTTHSASCNHLGRLRDVLERTGRGSTKRHGSCKKCRRF